jgi:hypothetical protein
MRDFVTYYGFSMARWLLVKNRRPSGSWPVTIRNTKRSSGFRKGSDGEVRSWAELHALATAHGIERSAVGGPGHAEMEAALGPASDE